MKKIFTLLFMATMSLTAVAQLEDGFYRIKNVSSERYIVMYDSYVLVNKITGTVNLTSLQTRKSFSSVRSHMGSVWYMQAKGDEKYDLFCQHSSLGANSDGFYPKLFLNNGSYLIYGTYSSWTKYLSDENDEDTGEGNVSIEGNMRHWEFIPLGGDNYIGVEPETSADGYYWATFISGFAFTLSSGMKAYYVKDVDDHSFTMKELGDEVPAKTPVILRLNGSSPSDNIIHPKKNSSVSKPSDNKLYEVWYSSNLGGKHEDKNVTYKSNYRILGKAGGSLAFVKADDGDLVKGKYIQHNRGYLAVSSSADSNIIESTSGITNIENDENEDAIYTLSGQRVPEGTTPRPGIYIKGSKKMVIK